MSLFYGPLWLCIILIVGFNVSIYTKLQGTSEGAWFATQSFFYALAFCLTWTPSTIWSAPSWNSGGYFALDFMAALCEPLGAFWNLLIFLRDRPTSREKLWNMLCCKSSEEDTDEAPAKNNASEQESAKNTSEQESASTGDEDSKPE
jgi:hypothetical protein